MRRHLLRTIAAALASAAPALSQWSSSPQGNLVIANRSGLQRLPKIAATSDGGCYIGWFDPVFVYQLWLQRLDRHGVEQWPHNGRLVSNHPQSPTLTEWDLIVDSEDNCVLAFTDARAGGDVDVYAYRIDPTGAMLWGPDGVTLSDTSGDESGPRMCEASDGDFVFVWANNGTATVRLQRLDRAGSPRYAADGIGIVGSGLPAETPGMARVVAADNGSVILSWLRSTHPFGARFIHAQKFDAPGNPQWNAGSPVVVFDTFSVPLRHEPILLPDGLGGAVIVWHWTPSLPHETCVQRLDASGNELYPHNGVNVSTTAANKRDPAAAFDVATQGCFIIWTESPQLGGLPINYKAQKIDQSGTRVWSDNGRTILAGGGGAGVTAHAIDGGFMAFIRGGPVLGMRVDGNGTVVWTRSVSWTQESTVSLQTALTRSSAVLVVWAEDGGVTDDDIRAQNVGSNGALAPTLAAVTSGGCGVNPAGSLTSGTPAIGTSVLFRVDNPVGTQAPGSIPFLVLATAAPPTFPCGIVVPGLGMAGAGADGEILVDLDAVNCLMWLPPWAGAGQPSELTLGIPLDLAFVGVSVWFQGALLDPTPGAPVPIGVTSGVQWTLGY